jgi:hypothetical protein
LFFKDYFPAQKTGAKQIAVARQDLAHLPTGFPHAYPQGMWKTKKLFWPRMLAGDQLCL